MVAWRNKTVARVRLCLIGATFLLPVLCGAAGTDTRYTDKEYHYSVTPPSGWSRKTEMHRQYVAFLEPDIGKFQTNFNIYTEPAANKTLAQYVRVSRETIAKSKEMRLQSDRKLTLGGSPAQLLQSLVTADGHPPSIVSQVLAVHGGCGYIVTFTALPAEFPKVKPVFDKVLSSFRWQP
jgi:hypothetical protein